jgi:hypothetical protein
MVGYNAGMGRQSKIPRKGEQVRLASLPSTFTILATRSQTRVVDLQLIGDASRVMYDVP